MVLFQQNKRRLKLQEKKQEAYSIAFSYQTIMLMEWFRRAELEQYQIFQEDPRWKNHLDGSGLYSVKEDNLQSARTLHKDMVQVWRSKVDYVKIFDKEDKGR